MTVCVLEHIIHSWCVRACIACCTQVLSTAESIDSVCKVNRHATTATDMWQYAVDFHCWCCEVVCGLYYSCRAGSGMALAWAVITVLSFKYQIPLKYLRFAVYNLIIFSWNILCTWRKKSPTKVAVVLIWHYGTAVSARATHSDIKHEISGIRALLLNFTLAIQN